jgi:ribonuclease R
MVHLGEHTSTRERRAMKIEMDIKELRKLELLQKCDEKLHKAVVTGIRDFGVFVELEEYFVEGMLTRNDLSANGRSCSEYLPERTGGGKKNRSSDNRKKGFHLGEEVYIMIREIKMDERRCYMEYAGEVK